ncbi:chorismate mutase [Elioraea sp. Yellowstone]|jgi:chorismate mutase|uniref:chorismate mutase n=1 Tax=Elioraea sp. Yellowstone TaxID=2592070 RepID=UPI0011503F74|nr:chorismate mutase [Elioraea sp. Yellowstone]TQF79983.1 chorismate mutase [Elioraea sp. Yellowstone]
MPADPTPAPDAEAEPGDPAWPGPERLAGLRAEIDRLDALIHHHVMRRAEVVASLARLRLKSGTPFRPAREAGIMRRLLADHRGPLPRATVIGMWREMIMGMTLIQAPFPVAVWSPEAGSGHVALAREHFGTAVPLRWMRSTAQVLHAVGAGEAAVGVLPLPQDDPNAEGANDPWWIALMRGDGAGLSVVARLPFVTLRREGAPRAQALVVAALQPEASGEDRSLVAFEADPDFSRARLHELVGAAGFKPLGLVLHRAERAPTACLAEVDGLVEARDPRLAALAETGLVRPVVIGAWPVPPPEHAFAATME